MNRKRCCHFDFAQLYNQTFKTHTFVNPGTLMKRILSGKLITKTLFLRSIQIWKGSHERCVGLFYRYEV